MRVCIDCICDSAHWSRSEDNLRELGPGDQTQVVVKVCIFAASEVGPGDQTQVVKVCIFAASEVFKKAFWKEAKSAVKQENSKTPYSFNDG